MSNGAGHFAPCYEYSNCGNASVYWGGHCEFNTSRDDAIGCGPCLSLHLSSIPGLTTTWFSACAALLLAVSFVWVLRANNKNLRAALAGARHEVITISWYTKCLDGVLVWSLLWAVYKFFKTPGDGVAWHYAAEAVVRSFSAALEIFVFMLLARNGVGARDFAVAKAAAVAGGLVPLGAAVYSLKKAGDPLGADQGERVVALGRGDADISPMALRFTSVIALLLFFFIAAVGYHVGERNAAQYTTRTAFFLLAKFLLICNFGVAVGNGAVGFLGLDWGLCVADLSNLGYYGSFALVVYATIKKDALYWTNPDGSDATFMQYEFEHGFPAHGRSLSQPLLHSSSNQSLASQSTDGSSTPNSTGEFRRSHVGGGRLVDNARLQFVRELQSGSFGRVDEYIYCGEHVAIKTLTVQTLSARTVKTFKHEAAVFAALDHPNVVEFIGVRINPPNVGFVMEFCNQGDLYDSLQRLGRLNREQPRWRDDEALAARHGNPFETSADFYRSANATPGTRGRTFEVKFNPIEIARQIASAMAYLQTPQRGRPAAVLHRDLKSLNVMLTQQRPGEDFIAKLGDFGDAVSTIAPDAWMTSSAMGARPPSSFEHAEHSSGRAHGTPAWSAPEALACAQPNLKSDVYSFGVVLWELLMFSSPFLVVSTAELQVVHRELQEERAGRFSLGTEDDLELAGASNVLLTANAGLSLLEPSSSVEMSAASTLGSSHSSHSSHSSSSSSSSGVSSAPEIAMLPGNMPSTLRDTSGNRQARGAPADGEATTKLLLDSGELAKAFVLRRGARMPMPDDLPDTLQQLLVDCWKQSAEERPTFQEVQERLSTPDAKVTRSRFPFSLPIRFPLTDECAWKREGLL